MRKPDDQTPLPKGLRIRIPRWLLVEGGGVYQSGVGAVGGLLSLPVDDGWFSAVLLVLVRCLEALDPAPNPISPKPCTP